jgi:hypothetical protein
LGTTTYGGYGGLVGGYGGYASPVAYGGYGGYGAPLLGGSRVVSVTRSTVPLVGATTYGGYGGLYGGYGGYATPVASSALALDAADGVIDGRFHGAPIVGGCAF